MTSLTDGMTAVVFDFYGTLTPVSPSEAWASNAARLAAVIGLQVVDLLRVLDDSFPERISGALAGGPFIFNLGHGVLPQTPPENVAALARLLAEPGDTT